MNRNSNYRLNDQKTFCQASIFRTTLAAIIFINIFIFSVSDRANGDNQGWPSYMHDRSCSGISREAIEAPLQRQWIYTSPAAPKPAWEDPQHAFVEGSYELPRMKFDDAFYAVAAGGKAYFGSSVDNKVYCLDAATGQVQWEYFTNGPVRLAPTVYDGRVYVGSDDGYVYCLDASSGRLVWKLRGSVGEQRVLGNGKMISLWPIRTNVLVDDGIAYFCAGVFPGERVYVRAVNADDGAPVWQNDTIGDLETGRKDFAPQGYLLASKDYLFVPSGRINKFCFDRKTGGLLRQIGDIGTYAVLDGSTLYSGTQGSVSSSVQQSGRAVFASFKGKRIVVTAESTYLLDNTTITAVNRDAYSKALKTQRALARKRKELEDAKPDDLNEQLDSIKKQVEENVIALDNSTQWSYDQTGLDSLILAGDLVFAGGQNEVIALDKSTGQEVWRDKVNGRAAGLAAAGGHLLVSTDKGDIYCFAKGDAPVVAKQQVVSNPYPKDELTPVYQGAAEKIINETGIQKGYCLVLGCGTGRLAYEIAKRTEDLMIYGVESDAKKVSYAREVLDSAGLYGTRICVEQSELDSVAYSDYFANLIVCDNTLITGQLQTSAAEAYRMLKPCGGVLYMGHSSKAPKSGGFLKRLFGGKKLSKKKLSNWFSSADIKEPVDISKAGGVWAKLERGSLPGAGSWTHQYGDAGNPAASEDQLVKCPLGLLWFGEPGPNKFPSRHARNVAPLSINGRVFLQGVELKEGSQHRGNRYEGKNVIMCFDAYNGTMYWEKEIPGAYRVSMPTECGNLACNEDSIFVAAGEKCFRLDSSTGEVKKIYKTPAAEDGTLGNWAYVAVADGLLFGSTFSGSQYSDSVFAVDIETQEHRWIHTGEKIRNNAIAIDDGRIYFADSKASTEQQHQAAMARIEKYKAEKGIDETKAQELLNNADVRIVTALNILTGDKVWEKPVDVTGCGSSSLVAICKKGVLFFCGAYRNGHYWDQFLSGKFSPRRAVALSANDGTELWSKAMGYRTRPLVIGDTLYADPWAFDIYTGEQKTRLHPFTGEPTVFEFERPGHHCGTVSGCPNTLFFRSWWAAYYDLLDDYGTGHFSSIRLGCWINMIPANGLVIQPEASSGCTCEYSNQCTVVFQPRKLNKAWGIFASRGKMTPIMNMAINLGAPGDRRDSNGKLWLSYPRPQARMRLDLDIEIDASSKQAFFNKAAEYCSISNTESPWLYASGCLGVKSLTIPVIGERENPAVYTVRLGFADTENDKTGQRIFDIKLQNKLLEKNFDIIQAAGAPNKVVVKEFHGVTINDKLKIEFASKTKTPILNCIEITREQQLTAKK